MRHAGLSMQVSNILSNTLANHLGSIQQDLEMWNRRLKRSRKKVTRKDSLTLFFDTLRSEIDSASEMLLQLDQSKRDVSYDGIAWLRRLELYIRYLEMRGKLVAMLLEQRMMPVYSDFLIITDLITAEIHTVIMEKLEAWECAEVYGAQWEPLTGVNPGIFPGSTIFPNDHLPFPVLLVPSHYRLNVWDLVFLYHDYGFTFCMDTGIHRELEPRILKLFERESPGGLVSDDMVIAWLPEIIADIFGVCAVGPVYVSALYSHLIHVDVYDAACYDPVPSRFQRFLSNVETLQQMGKSHYRRFGRLLETRWNSLYGDPESNTLEAMLAEITPILISTLLKSKLETLHNHSIMDLLLGLATDNAAVQNLADTFLQGGKVKLNAMKGRSGKEEKFISGKLVGAVRLALEKWPDSKPVSILTKRFMESFEGLIACGSAPQTKGSWSASVPQQEWQDYIVSGITTNRIDDIVNTLS